jgi:hypothetical protein
MRTKSKAAMPAALQGGFIAEACGIGNPCSSPPLLREVLCMTRKRPDSMPYSVSEVIGDTSEGLRICLFPIGFDPGNRKPNTSNHRTLFHMDELSRIICQANRPKIMVAMEGMKFSV